MASEVGYIQWIVQVWYFCHISQHFDNLPNYILNLCYFKNIKINFCVAVIK